MERKSVDVFLPYTDNTGTLKEKVFTIRFISNRMIRENAELQTKFVELTQAYVEYEKVVAKQKELKRKVCDIYKAFKTKLKERKAAYAKLSQESDELRTEAERLIGIVNAKAAEDLFKQKTDLIIRILTKNGCQDKDALTFEFWDESVEPSDFAVFLNAVVLKDADPQKKKTESTLTKAG